MAVIVGGTSYELPADDSQAQKVPLYNSAITALAATESGAGTGAFPTSPAPVTNDRFFRTDRSIEYFWNGTRWLSTQLYIAPLPAVGLDLPYAATIAGAERLAVPYATTYDLWLVEMQCSFYIVAGTALSASHKWVTTLTKSTSSVATVIATLTIDSGSVSVHRSSSVAIGALLGTTNLVFYTDHTKTGTPGNLHTSLNLAYRLVG